MEKKIRDGNLQWMRAIRLDLEHDRVPPERYHLIVSSMVMHHVADLNPVLRGFYDILLPAGALCIADLDTEPGLFHTPEAAESVHHHGFDPEEFQGRLQKIGFTDIRAVTASVVSKPVPSGGERDFPVFLITGRRP